MKTYPPFFPETAEEEAAMQRQYEEDLREEHETSRWSMHGRRSNENNGDIPMEETRTMTLEQIYRNGAAYAFNEITGQIVEFTDGPAGSHKTVVPGKTSPESLCLLLFDEKAILESWNALPLHEARERIGKYCGHLLRPVDGESGICDRQIRFGARLSGQNDFLSFRTQII